uniref:Uma2 family endonuclease n=1 Tax=Prochlorothrix hollandica TaxID=1223 RepID=UPI00333E73EE
KSTMIALSDHSYMTFTDYLAWEIHQDEKYEYLNGEAYAMTGGTIPHNAIAVNLIASLHGHLRGRSCQVLGSDAKVIISDQGPSFYPDLVVTCDPRDRGAITAIRYPCVIIEVLSPTTEHYDRGQKFHHYRRLETLRDYLLVSSDRLNVELFHLSDGQKWEFTPYEPDDRVQLASLDFECSIAQIYEDIIFPDPTPTPSIWESSVNAHQDSQSNS